jgi:hypothetical protein
MIRNLVRSIYGKSSIEIAHFDPLTNMAAAGNSCFRLVDFYEYSSLKLLDQNGMSNSHRGTSIYASYHVSVHLAKLFQSRRFLEIDLSETRIAGKHLWKVLY